MSKDQTHGKFEDNAYVSQALKNVMKSAKNWDSLTPSQVEALEMIALNVSRILGGDNNYSKHWQQIKNYAELGCSGLQGSSLHLEEMEASIRAMPAESVEDSVRRRFTRVVGSSIDE